VRIMGAKLLDVIALLEDIPSRNVVRGQVGTVVEVLSPGVFEVEFSGDDGGAYAALALSSHQFLVLRHSQVSMA
jgi:hypothetical protein